MVVIHLMSRAEHAVRVIEELGRVIHDQFVRIQHFLFEHLQSRHRFMEGVQVLRKLTFL